MYAARIHFGCCGVGLWLLAHVTRADVQGPWTFSIAQGAATIEAFDRTYAGHVEIPHELGGAPVTVLWAGAFMDCTNLTSVHIPATVTQIHDSAFLFCFNLTNITVHPDNPAYCSVEGALLDKAQTVMLLCPAGREGRYEIPLGVHTIGAGAFHTCTKLAEVVLPPTITTIRELAFHWCTNLTSLTIPGSVQVIEQLAFFRCSGLTNLVISDGVLVISNWAFAHCYQLPNVAIPASVVELGERPFSGCLSLTNITVAPDNLRYSSHDGVLYDHAQTVCLQYPAGRAGSYALPPTVHTIAEGAFEDCEGLTALALPNSLRSIGAAAFYRCTGLTSLVLPESVVELGSGAFAECLNLQRVYILGDAPSVGAGVFRSAPVVVYSRPGTAGWNSTLADRPVRSWDVRFEKLQIAEGQVVAVAEGTPDIPVALEVSTDLVQWRRIAVTHLVDGYGSFVDTDSTNALRRFYRLTGW